MPSENDFFPQQPFEKIALALSGGGFRATTYGLGVLAQLNSIRIQDDGNNATLLEKVRYVTGTSGGTITLSVYAACIHKGLSFEEFYHHLNTQLKGEQLVHEAIRILQDDNEWKDVPKSRNVINAFSKVYHDKLFGIMGPSEERVLESLMNTKAHVEEFCFNATEFFTGIPFKFQGSDGWMQNSGGRIGNNNIRINTDNPTSWKTLGQLRLSDVLACSSCFPTGFEPMVYPRDFTYRTGPGVNDLKNAVDLRTYSTAPGAEPDPRSRRAQIEKTFAAKGEFSIMDGGIVDNQGLDALMEANDRNEDQDVSGNRFDLIMVCDVASFYMDPYTNPEIDTSKKWMKTSLLDYWKKFRHYFSKVKSWANTALIIGVIIAILFLLPLILDEQGIAEIILAVTGIIILIGTIIIRNKINPLVNRKSKLGEMLQYSTIADLAHAKLPPEEKFQNRVIGKMAEYVQNLPTGVVLQMIQSRVQSSQVMIGEIFLKHVRRLIFNHLYIQPKLKYRRLNNVIYQLTFTNDNNRRNPAFEASEQATKVEDEKRRLAFLQEWQENEQITDDMKSVAEMAYNTGTTLWFEDVQESDPTKNNRRALIATGQFTTCYNLLRYTLSLKHSRNFQRLEAHYQDRVHSILAQLKKQLDMFRADPYWMEKEYARKGKPEAVAVK